jgi:hypothetical protein
MERKDGMTMKDPFDKWLADTLPNPREDAMEGRIHLAILRDRLNRKRRRRNGLGFLAVAVPVLLVAFMTGDVVDLGSDDFATETRTSDDGTIDYVISPFSEEALNVVEGSSEEETRELLLQTIADEGTPTMVEGWLIDGKTHWSMTRTHLVDGKKFLTAGDPKETPSDLTPALASFVMTEWKMFNEQIESGAIAPHSEENVVLDGVAYPVQLYILQSEASGEVIYYRGDISP